MKRLITVIGILLTLLAGPSWAVEPINLALAPAILGGAGAGAAAAGCTWQTVLSVASPTSVNRGVYIGYRNLVPANAGSYSGSKIRVTVMGGTGAALNLSHTSGESAAGVSICPAGSPPDCTTTPTRILWGSSYNPNCAASTECVSDELTFSFDKTAAYLINFSNGDNAISMMRDSGAGTFYYNESAGSGDYMVADVTGYTQYTEFNGVTKLEVCSP